jgi:hypothetical protein
MFALKDRTRLWLGLALVAIGIVVAMVGYAGVRDESDAALQLPYLLSAGVTSVALIGLGLVALRSHDDRVVFQRMGEMEEMVGELRESNSYLTRMLEAALLPDDVINLDGVKVVSGGNRSTSQVH